MIWQLSWRPTKTRPTRSRFVHMLRCQTPAGTAPWRHLPRCVLVVCSSQAHFGVQVAELVKLNQPNFPGLRHKSKLMAHTELLLPKNSTCWRKQRLTHPLAHARTHARRHTHPPATTPPHHHHTHTHTHTHSLARVPDHTSNSRCCVDVAACGACIVVLKVVERP